MRTRSNTPSLTKGYTPREPEYPPIETYRKTMNILLKSLQIRNPDHAKNLYGSLNVLAHSLFMNSTNALECYRPSKEDDTRTKIRFNDNVCVLRTIHNKTMQRIKQMTYQRGEL